MNAFKRIWFLPLLVILTTACETAVRAPLCTDNEMQFPPGVAGRYRMSSVGSDMRYSGVYLGYDLVEFVIRDSQNSIDIEAYSAKPQAAKIALGSMLAGSGEKRPTTIRSQGEGAPVLQGEPVMLISVCKIGKSYYSQTYNEVKGAYVISRFDLSSTGISMVGLLWDPDGLAKKGIRTHFIPEFDDIDNNGRWNFNIVSPVRMVVDNAGMSEQDRESLMGLAHPSPFAMVLSRVPEPSSFVKTGKPFMSFKIARK